MGMPGVPSTAGAAVGNTTGSEGFRVTRVTVHGAAEQTVDARSGCDYRILPGS